MQTGQTTRDVWRGVHRRLARPIGWLLMLAGCAVWIVLALVRWFQAALTIEWLAGTAVTIGLTILLASIGLEQYRHWKDERYKDVER